MKKRLRMLVQASMACMLALSSVALPAQVHAASETQIVSDISISSLRDVKNLERMVWEMEKSEINSAAAAELDVQFHTAVAECTHNDVLVRVVPIIIESIRRSHGENRDDQDSFKRAKVCHAGICKAISEGNVIEAKFMAERHAWETLNYMKETEERK